MPTKERRYAGSFASYSGGLAREYYVDVPGDPGAAAPARHRADAGHLVDTSGRDEAPRGGGWGPMEFFAEEPKGLPDGSPATFARTHGRAGGHGQDDGGGSDDARAPGRILAYLRGRFPARPNGPATLDYAGAGGAAHGGQGERGMDPSNTLGRRTVDGRVTVGGVNLGHSYTIPIERRPTPLHFNRPRLRRILAPSIARERGGPSPGGYSSQYDASRSARTAGPVAPHLRRLILAYGQAEYDEASQSPAVTRAADPGPIGNGGW